MFEVEALGDEVGGECVQQCRVGRRVGDPHVVFWIDQPTAKEMLPITVGERSCEVRVVRCGHPIDQGDARIGVDR